MPTWTQSIVKTMLTKHFIQYPGARPPSWLPSAPPWQRHLVTHCQAKADHKQILHVCREWHWARSTHYRRLNWSAALVADSLNLKEACHI